MKKLLLLIAAASIFFPSCSKANTRVAVETSLGTIQLELYDGKAPETVKNFLSYVDKGFYNGTIFHRVIKGFMIQGGGFTSEMLQKQTEAPIKNEAANGLKNLKGTIAMARTQTVDSATSQFFINTADNAFLDHGVRDFGYCVFGKVISGMETVKTIETVKTGTKGLYKDVPVNNVTIIYIRRIK